MLAPQTIDPSDAIIVFDSMDVITQRGKDAGPTVSDYQEQLSDLGYSYVMVKVHLLDMTDLSEHVTKTIKMTYKSSVDVWSVNISDIANDESGSPTLISGHKYTGFVRQSPSDDNPVNPDMRSFQILEFVVDDRGLEKTLMTQGYELDFSDSQNPIFKWVDEHGNPTYTAKAYSGGTGTNPATNPADVTHRGPIIKV